MQLNGPKLLNIWLLASVLLLHLQSIAMAEQRSWHVFRTNLNFKFGDFVHLATGKSINKAYAAGTIDHVGDVHPCPVNLAEKRNYFFQSLFWKTEDANILKVNDNVPVFDLAVDHPLVKQFFEENDETLLDEVYFILEFRESFGVHDDDGPEPIVPSTNVYCSGFLL